ncbi:hypothetical protein VNO78_20296 [Psophocarpus tetragonolobus]|uniref:WRKY domain-containing protein n=1 Tax=Psophocarpus tetragonolobus TaxID=3891 RepID=A0AAN9S918_PSOTE
MSTDMENNSHSEIICVSVSGSDERGSHDFSETEERSGSDLHLNNEPIFYPISEVYADDHNCLEAMEECQGVAPALDMPLIDFTARINEKIMKELICLSEEESETRSTEFGFGNNIQTLPSTELGLAVCSFEGNIQSSTSTDLDLELKMSVGWSEQGCRWRKRKILKIESRIEDDGYRWRKYGEKTMRDNIHPR